MNRVPWASLVVSYDILYVEIASPCLQRTPATSTVGVARIVSLSVRRSSACTIHVPPTSVLERTSELSRDHAKLKLR